MLLLHFTVQSLEPIWHHKPLSSQLKMPIILPIMCVLNFIYIRNTCKIKTQNTCLFCEDIVKIDQNVIISCDYVTWGVVLLKYFKMKYLSYFTFWGKVNFKNLDIDSFVCNVLHLICFVSCRHMNNSHPLTDHFFCTVKKKPFWKTSRGLWAQKE